MNRSLRGALEALVLVSGVWLSLASSSDDESGGGGSTTTPPVETRTPCQTNAECPGFVQGNLCVDRGVCGADKFCTIQPGVSCPTSNNPCQIPTCEPTSGACFFAAASDGSYCDDGQPCTNGDSCKGGTCFGSKVECGGSGPCASYQCNPTTGGCDGVYQPNGAKCDDGTACTANDSCQEGSCFGTQLSCDDFDTCTYDTCDPSSGCLHQSQGVGQPCDDGNVCTVQDACSNEGCKGIKTTVACDDGNPCTEGDICSDGSCQSGAVITGGCDDGDPCTANTTCAGGKCGNGTTIPCADDGNPCTSEACTPGQGCLYQLMPEAPCVPGNQCAATGFCTGEGCLPSSWKSAGTACDDGNPCSTKETCQGDVCMAGEYTAGAACADGDACTTNEHCDALGNCLKETTVCDDLNSCTTDWCEPDQGCQHAPLVGSSCDDNNACTQNTVCQASGACGGGNPTCDDQDPCTKDTCAPNGTCTFPLAVGTADCPSEVDCTDNIDNDKDGLVDCAELGCFRTAPGCSYAFTLPWAYAAQGPIAGYGASYGMWDAIWRLAPGNEGYALAFKGTAAGSSPVSGPPATSQLGYNSTYAQHCCFNVTTPSVLTWLEYVDWDTAALSVGRQVGLFTVTQSAKGASLAPNESYPLPLEPGAQGRWIRREVSLPVNPSVGFVFELAFGTSQPSGDPGGGWLIDDVHVLAPEDCNSATDTNGDGKVGCADPTCRSWPACAEGACNDNVDNNNDGFTDCDDQDCAAAPNCQ